MDTWIALARGPLFRIALTICVLGLCYRLGVALWQIVSSWRRASAARADATSSSTCLIPSSLSTISPLR